MIEKLVNKAKEAKEVGRGGSLTSRLQALLKKINEDRKAKEALRQIVERGCDETETLTLLFWFCGGTQDEIRNGLSAAKRNAEVLLGVSGRLMNAVTEARKILPELPRYGYISYDSIEEEERRSALDLLEDFAGDLAALGAGYENKGIPQGGREKRKGKSRKTTRFNPTAGRGEHLLELMELISDPPGPSIADFRLLAPLVRIVANDSSSVKVIAKRLQSRYEKHLPKK